VRIRTADSPLRRAEARLWTGPVAHLIGGALDLLGAVARLLLARARGRLRGRTAPRAARDD
jgi:hypothetical protein